MEKILVTVLAIMALVALVGLGFQFGTSFGESRWRETQARIEKESQAHFLALSLHAAADQFSAQELKRIREALDLEIARLRSERIEASRLRHANPSPPAEKMAQ
jgi:hypothetical protein